MDKQEWSGEGLPPVGSRCLNSSDEEVVIMAISRSGHDFCAQRVEVGDIYLTGLAFLKPVRSAEDKAVEAMVAATDEHLTPEDTCRALYRAGYRKIEE